MISVLVRCAVLLVIRAAGGCPQLAARLYLVPAGFAIPYIGARRVLWGSDFPHIRSIGLDADATVAKLIAALPSHEQKMVVGGNAAEVFRLGR